MWPDAGATETGVKNPTAHEIVQALKEDPDRGAWLLMRRYGSWVLRQLQADYKDLLRTTYVSEHEIIESRDEAVLRIIRYIDSYDESRQPLSAWWLFISKRCMCNIFRGRKHREGRLFDEGEIPFPRKSDKPMSKKQERLMCRLNEEIERLPPKQKAITLLDMAAGGVASAKETAKRLETTPNSVCVSRKKARDKLKNALDGLISREIDE